MRSVGVYEGEYYMVSHVQDVGKRLWKASKSSERLETTFKRLAHRNAIRQMEGMKLYKWARKYWIAQRQERIVSKMRKKGYREVTTMAAACQDLFTRDPVVGAPRELTKKVSTNSPGNASPASIFSSLPEPGDAVLDITVASQLGQGRVGTVHIADVRSCSVPVDIPPFVVKVANRDFCDNLFKKAWMYKAAMVLGWDRVATTKLPTSILFLERVGGYSPLGEPVPQTVQDDLWSITKDFGELHIFAKDLRYDNVLLAPDSPPGLPSLVSPSSHRSYGLRVVDFDLEYKVNLPPQSLDFHHRHPVRLILDKVPSGNVVNPFDD
ncbi:hypothetical protein GLOTRDRAFT_131209 [Gloeophyllum trabeum ATCC 11539]|uniref:Protein kinase domain-containing protein n=1 Tax=Gloeophyllum trabeum (strain ATCC 11539 / FP-39264 / Madison 617) TaxID=670483 RepID=S7PZM3_GLOTA|nr:uncharacterized protein GLOTRDRAFT_131209 [Gloeophyllum trabeum ATCC 11539]EPQ52918.1 hypothetical protein GLOTRDRAFT_131209 [Gloeophyllum trabeum ATCC 11539]